MKTDSEKEASRIADAIVELVERTDGPVPLCEIEREIPGFAAQGPPYWSYVIERNGEETVYWAGMTEAGMLALGNVMRRRRVAIQLVNVLPYVLLDDGLGCENWQPIVLLPAKAANLDSPKWLLRASPLFQGIAKQTPSWRVLTPQPVGGTADGFSL
jgi:hypothetical protein